MTLPPLANGGLPIGRWPATTEDLDRFASQSDASHRRAILGEWHQLTDAIRDAVGEVAAVWLGGSFFSTKEKPGDIDAVYIVRRDLYVEARKDDDRARFLQAVVGKGAHTTFGLRVDTFFLEWWPRPGVKRGSADRRTQYLESRGYWDDLWSRSRSTDLKIDQVPTRGYLEVILDGYNR
jgi:hypothetical protein